MKRKFIIPLFIFFVPVVGGCILAEVLARSVPESYKYNSQRLEVAKNDIEVLILGSSQMLNAVNAALIVRPSINLASGDQHHDTDFKIAKDLLKRLPKLNTVVIEVSYSHFEFPFNGPDFWKNNVYLSYYDIDNFERATYFKDRSLFFAHHRLFSEKIYDYYINSQPVTGFNRFGFDTLNYNGLFKKFDYDKSTFGKFNFKINTIENLDIFRKNTDHFNEMLRYFDSEGIQVVICKVPMYETFLRKRNTNILRRRDSMLELVTLKFPKVKLLDSEEDTTTYRVEDYINPSHLNPTGAAKFTQSLSDLLDSLD